MKKTINEIFIKVADKFPVDEKFEFDEDIKISLKGEIVKKSILNNNDGTIDLILHFKAQDYIVDRPNLN